MAFRDWRGRFARSPSGGADPKGCLIALGVVAAAAVLGFCGLACLGSFLPPPPQKSSGKKVWLRDDLKVAIMGKTREEVRESLGRPMQTDEDGWLYKNVSRDPEADRIDGLTRISFGNDGRVARLTFYP